MDIKDKIGARIKIIRQGKNLSQEDVAYKGDIDRTFMTHVENGRRNVSVKTLEKILIGLGISYRDFFNDSIFN